MKHLVAAAMTVMLLALCFLLVTESRSVTNEYEGHIKNAEEEEEKGLYLNAINSYQMALDVYDEDWNIKYKIVEDYYQMGDIEGWEDAILLFINGYPEDGDKKLLAEAYIKILDYYYENKDYSELIPMIERLKEEKFVKKSADLEKKTEEYYNEISAIYTINACQADNISDFYAGYAKASYEDGKQNYLITENSGKYNELAYDDIFILDSERGYSLVKEKGIYKVYTNTGYLKEIDENELEDVKYYNSAYIVGKKAGRYHMYSYDFNDAGFGDWEDFCLISQGIACITDNGVQKILIGSKDLTDDNYLWDKVVCPKRGVKENGNQIFVGKDDKFDLISIDTNNTEYEVIAKGFEDADAFNTTEPAAVKKDGKWGFISSSGKIVIEPEYEEAKSFSYGYAPVKIDGNWTLIDTSGRQVLSPDFKDMGAPTEDGVVPVSFDGKKWDLISLFIKNY